MITDRTPRWLKVLDALSQLANVALLSGHQMTTSNESISGRAHRSGWPVERWIDALFLPLEGPGHCRKSHEADLNCARALIAIFDQEPHP